MSDAPRPDRYVLLHLLPAQAEMLQRAASNIMDHPDALEATFPTPTERAQAEHAYDELREAIRVANFRLKNPEPREAYLATATKPESVARIAEAVGYVAPPQAPFPDFLRTALPDPSASVLRHTTAGEYWCDNGEWGLTVAWHAGGLGWCVVKVPNAIMNDSLGTFMIPQTYAEYKAATEPYAVSEATAARDRLPPSLADDSAPF